MLVTIQLLKSISSGNMGLQNKRMSRKRVSRKRRPRQCKQLTFGLKRNMKKENKTFKGKHKCSKKSSVETK